VGCNSVVLGGVIVEHGAVIGAGAVVTKDVPPYAIVVGNPARVLRYRFPRTLSKGC
jgi:virginiamycin A acetyltransferase